MADGKGLPRNFFKDFFYGSFFGMIKIKGGFEREITMAISGSPKVFAYDIAAGFHYLTQISLRKYTPADLRIISKNLDIVQREIRGEQVDLEDTLAIKHKNRRIQRISQALMVLHSYCKQRKIPL